MAWSTAKVTLSGSGNQTAVAGQTGLKIKLLGWALTMDAAVDLKWKSGSSTDLSGLFKFSSSGLWESMHPMQSKMATATGEALVLNLSGAGVNVTGEIYYLAEA